MFFGNGFFGNETNGDLANAAFPAPVNNCFIGDVDLTSGAPTSSPANLQSPAVAGVCGQPWNPDAAQEVALTEELGCADLGLCTGLPFPLNPPPVYPTKTGVALFAIPQQPGMDNPCVPDSEWCESRN